MSVLIARASGHDLPTFLRERIFEPLGMKDTGFSVPAEALDRLVTSYWTNPASGELGVYDEAEGGQWSRPPAFPSSWGSDLNHRRLPGLWTNDAFPGQIQQWAHPVEAFNPDHDDRSAYTHAESDIRAGSGRL